MAEERKRKHWETDDDEQLCMHGPDDKIACTTCKYRLPELLCKDGYVINQAKKDVCVYYQNKPRNILWKGAECEHFEEYDQPKLMTMQEWDEKYRDQFFPNWNK